MEICYLPVERLRLNEENLFKPLVGEEYKDLRESIAQHGVEEPLIVIEENGSFKVISGNNRLRVASDLGIKTLPCSIKEITGIEGAIDTEIFRRHLSPKERTEYKVLKVVKCKETLEKEKKNLIPELFDQYKKGIFDRNSALSMMRISVEEQTKLFQSIAQHTERVLPEKEPGDKEVRRLKKEIDSLNKTLSARNDEIDQLKSWKKENKEKIEDLIAELKEKEGKVEEAVKKRYEKSIKELEKTNEKLAKIIKAKEAQAENAQEEAEKIKRLLSDKEVEEKAAKIVAINEEKSAEPIFDVWFDGVIKSLEVLYDYMSRYKDPSRQSAKVTAKISAITKILNKIENKVTSSR